MDNETITLDIKKLIASKELIAFERRTVKPDKRNEIQAIRGCIVDRIDRSMSHKYFKFVFSDSMLGAIREIMDKDVNIVYDEHMFVMSIGEYWNRQYSFEFGCHQNFITIELCTTNIPSFFEREHINEFFRL